MDELAKGGGTAIAGAGGSIANQIAALQAQQQAAEQAAQQAAEEAKAKPIPDSKPSSPLDLKFMDDPVAYVKEKVELFVTIAKRDPVEAIRFVPEVAGGLGALVVLLIALIAGAIAMSSPAAPSKEDMKKAAQKAKDAATDVKDKATGAVTSGADTAKTEVNKRATRSTVATE